MFRSVSGRTLRGVVRAPPHASVVSSELNRYNRELIIVLAIAAPDFARNVRDDYFSVRALVLHQFCTGRTIQVHHLLYVALS